MGTDTFAVRLRSESVPNLRNASVPILLCGSPFSGASLSLSSDDRFNIEVLKLLLQVAWSDGELESPEVQVIAGLGRSWSVPEAELQNLVGQLRRGNPLPPPDLGLLKSRPDEVLEAARALALADGKFEMDEAELISQVAQLIGAR